MKKAILFGATGLIGSHLLQELLANPAYDQVIAVVRRDPGIVHPKLVTLKGELSTLTSLKSDLTGNEVFIALGTTRNKTPDQKDYYRIDHDYPVLAAAIAKQNGASTVLLVSSVGADPQSKLFYLKTKGETEHDIIGLDFDHTFIFRPSMLMGKRREHRAMEKLILGIWPFVNPLLPGKWNKYKGIDGGDVAKAMVRAAMIITDKVKIFHWKEMTDLLRT